jgi:hypothetical protein
LTGSDVELAQTTSNGLRSNPFEVHVVHELSVGVERASTSPGGGEFGVRGYIPPVSRKM